MTAQPLVSLEEVSVIRDGKALLKNIRFSIQSGQHWALLGSSGSGKTLLTMALTGEVQHGGQVRRKQGLTVERIPQQHQFRNRSNTLDFYYQQRFQSPDAGDAYTLRELLRVLPEEGTGRSKNYLDRLHLEPLLDKPLIQLSNGENKRVQLFRALRQRPGLLILDNPFVGLDTEGRTLLHRLLNELAGQGLSLLLIAPADELPECITHVACLQAGSLQFSGCRKDYKTPIPPPESAVFPQLADEWPLPTSATFHNAVDMRQVSIRYEGHQILSDINWEVRRGSRWLVSGPNGAGKSTLLSLINADNPQAYANEIYVFDRRRGQGESIWDIKRHIGYVSPELHLFFERGLSAFQVVASGLFDTIGLFRPLLPGQEQQVDDWMHRLQLDPFRDQPLSRLSLGEQRMILLGRALVKNPSLLILDEPCQGLDEGHTRFFNAVVDQLCRRSGTTLIYVSHYTQDIPKCIDQFLELKAGRRVR